MNKTLIASAVALTISVHASAQTPAPGGYPSKPVKIVLSSPGGGTDVMARLFADHFSRSLGQQFVVEARAPNVAATNYVAKSPPDGYTLLVATASFIVNTIIVDNAPYDPVKDLQPISQLGSTPVIIVVHPSLPAKTLPELVKLAKAHPGGLNYGSGGISSPPHLSAELLSQVAGIRMVHVPYKGTAAAGTDLTAGRIQLLCSSVASVLPYLKSNRIRPLAVMASKRTSDLPDVPTTVEAGFPKAQTNIWYGLLGPKGMPQPIVDVLYQNVQTAIKRPDTRERLSGINVDAVGSSPTEYAAFIGEERARWGAVIRNAKIEAGPAQ